MNDRSVLHRAFQVLQVFPNHRRELTVSDVSRKSGLPLATAHRICMQLCEERALERLPNGRLRIGVHLWELGSLTPNAHGLREVALPFLEDLHRESGAAVQLCAIDGLAAVCIERLVGHSTVPLFGRPGGRLPLHASGTGLVLLAHAPDAVLTQLVRAGLERYTEDTIIDERELRIELSHIRQTGIGRSGALRKPWITLAVPIFGAGGRVDASICLMSSDLRELDRFEFALRKTAEFLGEELRRASAPPREPELVRA